MNTYWRPWCLDVSDPGPTGPGTSGWRQVSSLQRSRRSLGLPSYRGSRRIGFQSVIIIYNVLVKWVMSSLPIWTETIRITVLLYFDHKADLFQDLIFIVMIPFWFHFALNILRMYTPQPLPCFLCTYVLWWDLHRPACANLRRRRGKKHKHTEWEII